MDKLPFIPNQIYNRRESIHGIYKGNWQGGISPSSTHPYIFIFTTPTGLHHGYRDEWVNPHIFTYTGEGQIGDMRFIRGNLALRDHIKNGKRVFLFESVRPGFVRFIDEIEFYDVDYFQTHDSKDNLRIGIKFFFKRKGAIIPIQADLLKQPIELSGHEIHNLVKPPDKTERKGLITSRVGQGAYRKSIIHRWEYKCAVTEFDKLNLLIASHILPWAVANDNQRLDVHNGILLSPTYDALFDRHIISFENTGNIILSEGIEKQAFQRIGVTGNEKIKNLSLYNFEYLEQHRSKFYSPI